MQKSATVVIGDVNTARGEALIKELRESTGNEKYIQPNCPSCISHKMAVNKRILISVPG